MSRTVSAIRVREATPDDAPHILRFIRGLAEFEGEPPETVRTTEQDIRAHGFGEAHHFETLIAEHDGVPIGMALFFPTTPPGKAAPPSIWRTSTSSPNIAVPARASP